MGSMPTNHISYHLLTMFHLIWCSPRPQEIVRPIIARAPQMRPSRANTNWMLGWWGLGIWHLTYISTPHSWLFWYIVYKATSNPQEYGKSVPPGWWAWYLHIFTSYVQVSNIAIYFGVAIWMHLCNFSGFFHLYYDWFTANEALKRPSLVQCCEPNHVPRSYRLNNLAVRSFSQPAKSSHRHQQT